MYGTSENTIYYADDYISGIGLLNLNKGDILYWQIYLIGDSTGVNIYLLDFDMFEGWSSISMRATSNDFVPYKISKNHSTTLNIHIKKDSVIDCYFNPIFSVVYS